MDFAAPHAGFVVAAYAVTLAGLCIIVVATMIRDRRLSREVAGAEQRKRQAEAR
jgi:heme exporter protein CcmD